MAKKQYDPSLIYEAAKQIMDHKKLRKQFLSVYDSFPIQFDKNKVDEKKTSLGKTRRYDKDCSDYDCILRVLLELKKDEKLKGRILFIVKKCFESDLGMLVVGDDADLALDGEPKWRWIVFYFRSVLTDEEFTDTFGMRGELYIDTFEQVMPMSKDFNVRVASYKCKDPFYKLFSEVVLTQPVMSALFFKMITGNDALKKEACLFSSFMEHLPANFMSKNKERPKDPIKRAEPFGMDEDGWGNFMELAESQDDSLLTKYGRAFAAFAKEVFYKVPWYVSHGFSVESPAVWEKGLSTKEIRNITNYAFICFEAWYGRLPKTEEEQDVLARLVADFFMDEILLSDRMSFASAFVGGTSKQEREKDYTSLEEVMGQLKESNENLKKELSAAKAEPKKIDRTPEIIDGYEDEIRTLKKEKERLEARLSEKEEALKDLEELFDTFDDTDDIDNEETSEDDKATVTEYLNNFGFLVWGARPEFQRKVEEVYPMVSFTPASRALTRSQADAYDFVIICTNNTSHGSFYQARDQVKAAGKPFAYIKKGGNNVKVFERAVLQAANA